jgi:hypothetical protein
LDYIAQKPGFIQSEDETSVEPRRKKAKKSQVVNVFSILTASYFTNV